MAPRLNELGLVKPGALFAPPISPCDRFNLIHKSRASVVLVTLPSYVGLSVCNVDGPGHTVETHSVPVPELKREYIGRRTYFEHHAIGSRSMDGARRD